MIQLVRDASAQTEEQKRPYAEAKIQKIVTIHGSSRILSSPWASQWWCSQSCSSGGTPFIQSNFQVCSGTWIISLGAYNAKVVDSILCVSFAEEVESMILVDSFNSRYSVILWMSFYFFLTFCHSGNFCLNILTRIY